MEDEGKQNFGFPIRFRISIFARNIEIEKIVKSRQAVRYFTEMTMR